MRRTLILIVPLLLLSLTLFSHLVQFHVNASNSTAVQVDHIYHIIQAFDGGLVTLNNTVTVSATETGDTQVLSNFLIGFPHIYTQYLEYCFAYETGNPNSYLEVKQDFGLGRIGFYGVNVILPDIDLSQVKSYNFSVIFVFSDAITSSLEYKEEEKQEVLSYLLKFPLYPTLTQNANVCDVEVILPEGMIVGPSTFSEKRLNVTTPEFRIIKHRKSPLEEFTSEEGEVSFTAKEGFYFNLFEFHEVKREITLEASTVSFTESYHVTNRAYRNVSEINVNLPLNITSVSSSDIYGKLPNVPRLVKREGYLMATVFFREKLDVGESVWFTVKYSVPLEFYVEQLGWDKFSLNLPVLSYSNILIKKLTLSVSLLEGARFQSFSITPTNIQKNVFAETATFTFYSVTSLIERNITVTYSYSPLWISFRPTLWAGTLAAIACAVILANQASKRAAAAVVVPITPIEPEVLRDFVRDYEEKRKIVSELKSLERQVRKGKVSRRRYKMRRKMLENRLSLLTKEIAELARKIRGAGAKYADLIRQLEVAETELEGLEVDVRRIETRRKRGELSAEAYRNLLASYNQRRDKARTVIDGVLLRLREEIH